MIKDEAKRFGKNWCHMWTDGDIEELHKFARKIGMRKTWFQAKKRFPHYDLVYSKRSLALQNGAVYMPLRDWFQQQLEKKKNCT